VQVCPTGIDIRQGLQYECISCAACIDGCNQVMDKMGYPRGLIRYSTENALAGKYRERDLRRYVGRPRVLIYTAVLLALVGATVATVSLRVPLRVDILRDRSSLAREAAPGLIENVYEVQIMNTDERTRQFQLGVSGLPGIRLAGVDEPVTVEGSASRRFAVRVQVPLETQTGQTAADVQPGAHKIQISVTAVGDASVARHEKSSFIIPR
jgi:cytochrome c oxidase accessory protein FixG